MWSPGRRPRPGTPAPSMSITRTSPETASSPLPDHGGEDSKTDHTSHRSPAPVLAVGVRSGAQLRHPGAVLDGDHPLARLDEGVLRRLVARARREAGPQRPQLLGGPGELHLLIF